MWGRDRGYEQRVNSVLIVVDEQECTNWRHGLVRSTDARSLRAVDQKTTRVLRGSNG